MMRFLLIAALAAASCSDTGNTGDTGDTGDSGNSGDTGNSGNSGPARLVCVQCDENADCDGATPNCNLGLDACTQCRVDGDCVNSGTGLDCISEIRCATVCTIDDDCLVDPLNRTQCFEDICEICNEDSDCLSDPAGETCVLGTCTEPVEATPCQTNADCPGLPLDTCNALTGQCECSDDLDCDTFGGRCDDGVCTCTSEGDCTADIVSGGCIER